MLKLTEMKYQNGAPAVITNFEVVNSDLSEEWTNEPAAKKQRVEAGRCRLTVLKLVLTAPVVSALESII